MTSVAPVTNTVRPTGGSSPAICAASGDLCSLGFKIGGKPSLRQGTRSQVWAERHQAASTGLLAWTTTPVFHPIVEAPGILRFTIPSRRVSLMPKHTSRAGHWDDTAATDQGRSQATSASANEMGPGLFVHRHAHPSSRAIQTAS